MAYSGPLSSSARLVPKLILYKVKVDSPFYKFNHDLSTATMAKVDLNVAVPTRNFGAIGPDPSDLDISSADIYQHLLGQDLARLPYDSWIPRKIGLQSDAVSGAIKLAQLSASQKTYYSLEDIDAKLMRLSWKNVAQAAYAADFSSFIKLRKKYLLDALKSDKPFSDYVDSHDLTDFLIKYSHRTTVEDFGNTLSMTLTSDPQAVNSAGNVMPPMTSANYASDVLESAIIGNLSPSAVDKSTGHAYIPLIEENDVVELRIQYSEDYAPPARLTESGFIDEEGYERVFIGYVSTFAREFKYGATETVGLECHGVSKMLSLYDTQFVPSLASSANFNFEEGVDASDLRFSIFTNQFNSMSASDIFKYFMKYAMFSMSDVNLKELEADAIRQIERIELELSKIDGDPPWFARVLPEFLQPPAIPYADTLVKRAAFVARKAELEQYVAEVRSRTKKAVSLAKSASVVNLPGSVGPGDDLDLELFYTNSDFFENLPSFQTIYFLPLLLDAAKTKANSLLAATKTKDGRATAAATLSRIVGVSEQGLNIAYRTMIASAFRMFYPELKTPHAIFSEIRNATFLELFEDRPGVLRMRPPKYNIINLNVGVSEFPEIDKSTPNVYQLRAPAESVTDTGTGNLPLSDSRYVSVKGDHILDPVNIVGVSFARDDASIYTRADTSWQLPLGGEPLPDYTGAYSDPGYLMRYGLRTSGISQNPLALSPLTAKFISALTLALKNKGSRTAVLTVINNQEYQVGRLYYIPIATPSARGRDGVISRGIVGYVTDITTDYTYNGEPSHQLTLQYLRQAEILEIPQKAVEGPGRAMAGGESFVYYANFKKLPDLSTLIRTMASDPAANRDLGEAVSTKGFSPWKSGSHSGADCHGFLVLNNGMTKADTARRDISSTSYADTLGAMGFQDVERASANDRAAVATEQNQFCTPFSSSIARDLRTNSGALKNSFLGKLVLYEYDPALKFYPSAFSSSPVTLKFPLVNSTSVRRTYDLMHVILTLVLAYIDGGQVTSVIRDTSPGVADPTVVFSTTTTEETLTYTTTRGGGLRIRIVKSLQSGDTTLSGHVIRCFITRGNRPDKAIIFGVPVTKSLRLANMMSEGTIDGGGFRSTVSAETLSGKQAAGDMHTSGSAVAFSDLEVSLWSIDDIIDSCAEFTFLPKKYAAVSERTKEELAVLQNIWVNAMMEPHHPFDVANGRPPASIYSGYPISIADDHVKAVLLQLMSGEGVFFTNFVNINTGDTTTSFKDYIRGLGLKQFVLVPATATYMNTLFGNISRHQIKIAAGAETLPPDPKYALSTAPVITESKTVPTYAIPGTLTVMVNRLLAPTSSGSGYSFPSTQATGVMVDNRYNASDSKLSFFSPSDPRYSAVVNIGIDISRLEKVSLLTAYSNFSLRKYVLGEYKVGIGAAHFVLMADSLYFKLPVVSGINKRAVDYMTKHPLSFVWHGSYAKEVLSFQRDSLEFDGPEAKGSISMPPLQEPV